MENQDPLNCPDCNKLLSPWKLRDEFECSNCGAKLTSNEHNVCWGTIVLWTVAELPVRVVLWNVLDDLLLRWIVFGLISGTIGLWFHYILLRIFGEVKRMGDSAIKK
jgi:hypothetical protein